MTKLEILKALLNDEEIKEKHQITDDMISKISLVPYHNTDIIALLQHTVNTLENSSFTTNTAAANINNFIETRLREKYGN